MSAGPQKFWARPTCPSRQRRSNMRMPFGQPTTKLVALRTRRSLGSHWWLAGLPPPHSERILPPISYRPGTGSGSVGAARWEEGQLVALVAAQLFGRSSPSSGCRDPRPMTWLSQVPLHPWGVQRSGRVTVAASSDSPASSLGDTAGRCVTSRRVMLRPAITTI